MADVVVGREAELEAVAQLLAGVGDGPAVLVVVGEAGIGKSTVWSAGVAQAQRLGFTRLWCRPAAVEVRLSHAGLADLLAEVDLERLDLPVPQARALDAALLRGQVDGGSDQEADPRAVAAGFRSVLEALASDQPVLLAIDDIQWIDEPSRQVVEFAVRRCAGPVAVLATGRTIGGGVPAVGLLPRDPDRRRTVRLGPLPLPALRHLLIRETGGRLPPAELARIVDVSDGNPYFALELARGPARPVGRPGELPASLRAVVAERLKAVAGPAREALLVASALSAPRVEVVSRALPGGDVPALLGVAEDAGVVTLAGGMVRFTHPLLAVAAYSEAPPSARRLAHRRLSQVVEDVEEKARHLALAAVGPEPAAVSALDAAAEQARQRGAPAGAAELLELALGLGAGDPARQVRAAHDRALAGDHASARRLLTAAIDRLGPGELRADALALLGMIHFDIDADPAAVALLEQAYAEAAADPGRRCAIALDLNQVLVNSGRIVDSLPFAQSAVADAEAHGDPGLLAEALGIEVIVRCLMGEGVDEAALARALELEDPRRATPVRVWPSFQSALICKWTYQLDLAMAEFAAVRKRCEDLGEENDLWFVSFISIPAILAAGEIETASALVAELAGRAELLGTEQAWAVARLFQAQVWAWVGRVDEARTAGEEALALLATGSAATFSVQGVVALGRAALSVGDYEAAAGWLVPAAEEATGMGFGEPACLPFLPDTVEALVGLGRLVEAEQVVQLLEAGGRLLDNAWPEAVGARGRALLLAAQGRTGEALSAYVRALAAHDRLPQARYDRGRTLLPLGQLQRRLNQRSAARGSLTEAEALFQAVGAAQWAELARSEAARLRGRSGSEGALTPTERRVAELAASGLTNRETAAAMFMSPKTVEVHLSRVYRKLGIRSRAELGRTMPPPDPDPPDAPDG